MRLCLRQRNGERGARAGLARQLDLAGVLANDAGDDGKAEPGADTDRFGGEERLEDAGLELERNAGPIVLDVEEDAAGAGAGAQHNAAGTTGGGNRLLTVHEQIENHLLELDGIGERGREIGCEMDLDSDAGALEIVGAQAEGALDDFVEANGRTVQLGLASEHEQAADDVGGAFGFLTEAMGIGERAAVEGPFKQQMAVAHHRGEGIVQFVGDAGDHLAERSQFVSLEETSREFAVEGEIAIALDPAIGTGQIASHGPHDAFEHATAGGQRELFAASVVARLPKQPRR